MKLKHIKSIKFVRYLWNKMKSLNCLMWVVLKSLSKAINYHRYVHGIKGCDDREQLQRAILKSYHGVEKGLSLKEIKPGFGQDKIQHLLNLLDNWTSQYPPDDVFYAAISSLKEYKDYNQSLGVDVEYLSLKLEEIQVVTDAVGCGAGGTVPVNAQDIREIISSTTPEFFTSRKSVRNFSAEPVKKEKILNAARIAMKAPSVCNRQASRVYCFEDAAETLSLQPGNRGFGHLASWALVVTTDLKGFSGPDEINQAWVDGGLYSMSLLLGLHQQGVGACPLAWAVKDSYDKIVHRKLEIPHNEVIIMMIAVGNLPSEFKAAHAYRLDIDKSCIFR